MSQETESFRTPEWHYEMVREICEETGLFDSPSDYHRFADRFVAEQLFGQDIQDNVYHEKKSNFQKLDWGQLYDGVDRYFEGLLAGNRSSVEEGVELIRDFDEELGEDAEDYAERFISVYW